MTSRSTNIRGRHAVFVSSGVLIAAIIWILQRIEHLPIGAVYTSQTVLIPLLCAYLLWNERQRIFLGVQSASWKGVPFVAGATVAGLAAYYFHSVGNAYLFSAVSLLSAILMVIASFAAVYGWNALRCAVFPFCMLLFAVPFPDSVVQRIISILQAESAWLSAALFSLIGVPVFKQGFMLTVPGITIEVARECSGINSSIALVLTMILVARESLTSNWRRAVLVAATIPLSILKNAIRITTLTMLALRVDPGFLTGKLHHEGGFVFYLAAMGLMYPVWKLLKRGDRSEPSTPDVTVWKTSVQSSVQDLHTRA